MQVEERLFTSTDGSKISRVSSFTQILTKKNCSSIPISSEDAAAASTVSLSAEVQKLLMDDSDSKENEISFMLYSIVCSAGKKR